MSNCEHVNDDRMTDAHLDDIDGPAADWTPGGDGFALSYDEWLAARLANGQPAGEFDEYIREIDEAEKARLSWQLYWIRAEARRGEVTPLTPEEWAAYQPPF